MNIWQSKPDRGHYARLSGDMFSRRGWLSGTTAELRARMLGLTHPVDAPRGTRLFAQGDEPGGIYGVLSGGIAAEGSAGLHPVRIGHIVRAGDWFGTAPAYDGGDRLLGFVAVEDSRLVLMPLPAVQAASRADPAVAQLLGNLARRMESTMIWAICDLLIPEAPRRIAAVLLRVTAARDGVVADHPDGFLLNQSLIGELANASRAHVNRVLGMFAANHWIAKRYNHLHILDPQALAEFAYSEN